MNNICHIQLLGLLVWKFKLTTGAPTWVECVLQYIVKQRGDDQVEKQALKYKLDIIIAKNSRLGEKFKRV